MIYIDSKYIGMISSRLEKFVRKKEGLYNFRCPYCGDSQKHKNKARGYLYKSKSDHNFKCHNCGVTRSFTYFLKDLDEPLYKEYVLERYKEGLTGRGTVSPVPEFKTSKPVFKKVTELEQFKGLSKISELNTTHPAREYLSKRQIPERFFSRFYFVEDYNLWANNDNTFKESRIILPLISEDGNVFGYQARSLHQNAKLRYITTILDKQYPKLFGLDRINKNENIYVTEGPFDSLFIRNAIAMCGADSDLSLWGINDPTWIYDNEPRNSEIVSRISHTIDRGEKVVIWPSNLKEKDINDMVMSGYIPQDIIEENTFQGIQAKIKFTEWKKV